MKDDATRNLTIHDGTAWIEGVSVRTLADACGTPLYIYNEKQLKEQMRAYTQNFQSPHFAGRVVYATKAFNCMAMLKLCEENGLYVDAVSLGEIYTAKKAGIDMKSVYFHGNNKSV